MSMCWVLWLQFRASDCQSDNQFIIKLIALSVPDSGHNDKLKAIHYLYDTVFQPFSPGPRQYWTAGVTMAYLLLVTKRRE